MVIFEEFKNVICQNVEPNVMKIVKSILYRRSVLVFGGFIQFQAISIMDDVNLQHVSVVELYVEFEQIPYVVGAVEEVSRIWQLKSDVEDVANALANELTFQEPSFMCVLDEEALKAPKFAEDMNSGPTFVLGEEFAIGIEFNSRESVIKAVKEYTISRGVDYLVRESEPTTFYAQCV
ncbi:hypothetical protein PIB30_083395 [Stylosanthes scabra]|uniref:Uncharacterized protein n=1 Tax=Stylosanthes scabra TaxID=79078 RepID=A0ABU6TSQ5_9FABA|nr:hypothetical protein [Stylosanthes scabra]